jgi:hypothetical protein
LKVFMLRRRSDRGALAGGTRLHGGVVEHGWGGDHRGAAGTRGGIRRRAPAARC